MKTFTRGLLATSCLMFASTSALAAAPTGRANPRLLGTRAIVACDAVEKSCGVASISFPSGISGLVPYGRPDVAVASMFYPSVDDAEAIIARTDAGDTAQAAVDYVFTVDPYADYRQLAAVKLNPDGTITVGQQTGAESASQRCAVKGATFVVQANNQTTATICAAMATGFQQATGSLPQRLLASLKAGAKVGGDNNGERSGVIRVWSSENEAVFYTKVLADAVVHGSKHALKELDVEMNRYQAGVAAPYASDLISLDKETAKVVKRVLHKLGYYDGRMDGSWNDTAEQALYDFNWNNSFFLKPTVVVNGQRKIDGPLVNFMRDADLEALAPATH
ncbi:DUF1028 domain-containing protein [Corallococcus exiguus]|uniref:DUF1028 domain-containing protein n=1 Tax=Corallococcus exiguus TaxID=83462 RepID=A0A7X4Y811_9BACT|nr:DUF1028 domain-containing protein [Corallococcus exiguus]NBC39387.1 DUF1028 domain-containing protein [Corallococcus exiguus]TNV56701.1 DUF1028 domain-containing protein [Corallococcus exiguus]